MWSRTISRKKSNLLVLLLAFVLLNQGNESLAQQAPIGDHHAGIVKTMGGPSATGSYQLSLEMSFPVARGGILLPLEMRYNAGNKVGEGGLGWSIPKSYVLRESAFTRRRPHFASDESGPRSHQRIWLVLDDRPTLMIPIDEAKTRFRPMIDSQKILLIQEGEHWILKNGAGQVLKFEKIANLGSDATWFMTEINDSTGNNPIRLDYNVLNVDSFKELRLRAILYNFKPQESCAKHELRLSYRSFNSGTSSDILEYNIQNGQIDVRTKIVDRIDVLARGNKCNMSPIRIHSYKLDYRHDLDTRQPRLHSVDVFGKEGTAEEIISMPVARYIYGSVAQGQVDFLETSSISVPDDALDLASSAISSMLESGNNYSTRHMLHDFSGDGRMDLIFPKGGFDKKKVWIALNTPANPDISSGIAMVEFTDAQPLFTGDLENTPLGEQVTSQRRYRYGDQVNTEDTMVQGIDFNGDGRTDILDARNEGHWLLHLNVPSITNLSGIEWQTKKIDIEPIRTSLMAHGQWDITLPSPIPLKRSKTARDFDTTLCWDFLGPPWKQCPEHITSITEYDQHTRTEWMLTDINGDGWVDFVVNSLPIDRTTLQSQNTDCITNSNIPSISPGANESQRVTCELRVRVNFESPGNQLQVHLNMAGAQLRQEVQPFAPRISLGPSSCSVEEWQSVASGSNFKVVIDENGDTVPRKIGPWRSKVCGLVDVSGDGIQDRIQYGFAYLGTGQSYSASLKVPGPIARVFNGRDEVCDPNIDEPDPDAEYVLEQSAGFVDLTGDGILDYVSGDKVHVGSGTAWLEEIPIVSLNNAFTLSKSTETCEGKISKTVAGLFDVDGDGRMDFVEVDNGRVHMSQIVGDSGNIGAHDSGRIVSVENGLGASVEISYTSAKNDKRSFHQVPFPELVVNKVQTEGSDGSKEEPVHFAYGDAQLFFDVAVDRWVFSGYNRTVTLRGLKPEGSAEARKVLTGVASITDKIKPEELDPGYETYALAGRVKDIHYIDGIISNDVWSLLSTDFTSATTTFHRLTHYEYDFNQNTQAIPSEFDCTNMDDPYEMTGNIYFVFDKTKDWDCLSTGFGFARTSTQSQGEVLSGTATDFVLTRTRMMSMDDFGRPLMIAHDNDVFYEGDDLCERISYAQPTGGHHNLSSIHTRQFFHAVAGSSSDTKPQPCKKGGEILVGGIRYAYDGNSDTALEGSAKVSIGLQTQSFAQRYNTSTGSLIKDLELHNSQHDTNGNVTQLSSRRDDGEEPMIVSYEFDDFALVETKATITSDGTDTELVTTTVYDPVTLLPTSTTTPNATIRNQRHDGFGRATMVSVFDPSREEEFVTSTHDYLGWSGEDSEGRRVKTRVIHDELSVNEYDADPTLVSVKTSGTTMFIDEFGRTRRTEKELGEDYDGQVVILDDIYFDSLGRQKFLADPHLKDSPDIAYGTTFVYRPDNTLRCTVQGRGPQALQLSPSAQEARFPSCTQIIYKGHRKHLRLKTAEELTENSAHAGNYSETITTALGAPLLVSKWTADDLQRERMIFDYDHLGYAVSIKRFKNPESVAGDLQWRMQNDSFGQVVAISEPSAAKKAHVFDHWGNITETRWADERGIHKSISNFDVLGRIQSTLDMTNNILDPGTESFYHYDLPSSDPNHASSRNLLGRLSHLSNDSRTVFLSYDGMGNKDIISRVDENGSVSVERSNYDVDGTLASMSFMLPGESEVQTASYSYDSARRIKQIGLQLGAGPSDIVFDAPEIDPFGRYRRVVLGNGAEEIRDFAETDRREFKSYQLVTPTRNYQLEVNQYDNDLRVTERQEKDSASGSDLTTSFVYDNVFRLAKRSTIASEGSIVNDERFTYDGLGNISKMIDHVALESREFTTFAADKDRLCSIFRDSIPGPQYQSNKPDLPDTAKFPITLLDEECNYQYDALGNVTTIQETDLPTTTFNYDAHSRIRSLSRDNANGELKYGPLGEIVEVEVSNLAAGFSRKSKRFGPLVESTNHNSLDSGGNITSSISSFETRVLGPLGVFMLRRGDENAYWHAEGRGLRFVTGGDGDVALELDYSSFGELSKNELEPGSQVTTNYSFNGADQLSEFGVAQMGARLYKSEAGRFIQRDPILVPGGAGKSHPYSFSWNDPINYNDPSGLSPGCIGKECSGSGVLGSLIGTGIALGLDYILGGGSGGGQAIYPQSELKWALLGIRNVGGPTEFEKGLLTRKDIYVGADDKMHMQATQLNVWDRQGQLMKPVGYSLGGSVKKIYDRYGNLVTISEAGLESGFWYDPINFISGPGLVKGLVKGAAVAGNKFLTKRAVSKTMETIKHINPLGGVANCVSCAIATNASLSGIAASAPRWGPATMGYLSKFYKGTFSKLVTKEGIESTMMAAGSGAKGIVVGSYGWSGRHAFNVVNVRGTILFLDGQARTAASFAGFKRLYFLRTY
jgi:RHS repeat-associated protein